MLSQRLLPELHVRHNEIMVARQNAIHRVSYHLARHRLHPTVHKDEINPLLILLVILPLEPMERITLRNTKLHISIPPSGLMQKTCSRLSRTGIEIPAQNLREILRILSSLLDNQLSLLLSGTLSLVIQMNIQNPELLTTLLVPEPQPITMPCPGSIPRAAACDKRILRQPLAA